MKCLLSMAVGLLLAMAVTSPAPASAAPDWTNRPGTIQHALAQADGASACLDAVSIAKIRAKERPCYLVVSDWGIRGRIIVLTRPSEALRPGQTVDVEGTLTTLPNGERAVADARIVGYLDKKGNILLHGPLVKGITGPTPWPWKTDMTLSDNAGVMALDEAPTPPGEPSSSPASAPVFCATIADAKAQANGTAVELQCRPVGSAGSGFFVLGEDGSSDTLKTYYTHAVTTSYRVVAVTGTIQAEGTNKVLDVDSGPSYDPQIFTGSVTLALSGTIAWAKTFADWTELPTDGRTYALENKPVSWCDGSRVYIEEADRSSGILLNYASLPPNDSPYVASVTGVINTDGDGERSIDVYGVSYTAATSAPRPLGMSNRSTVTGLRPNGILLRAWGKVTAVNPTEGYLYIDDGSAVKDGTLTDTQENVGVRVQYNDIYFPSAGDFAAVTGPLGITYDYGTSTSVNCLRTRGGLDATFSPPPAPSGLQAAGGNATALLAWDPMNAAEYRVYRSTSEQGQYALVGTSASQTYADSTVTNGVTYWYKLSAANFGSEGPLAGPVDATPSASAPTVSVGAATVDSNGLLTLQCSGSCSGGEPIYTLSVDGEAVWSFTQNEIASIVYDTTQLPNGSHRFELTANYSDYSAVASQTLNIQNFISEFNVPDDMCGMQPISAKFESTTDWALTVTQGSTTLYSTSGTGESMEVAWDAGSAYGEVSVTLSANGKTRTAKSRKNSPSGGDYYAWSSIYVEDRDTTTEQCFQYMHSFAVNALQPKYGVSMYSGMISSDSAWQDVVLDDILDNPNIRCNHFVFSGHGAPNTTNPKQPIWHGVVSAYFSNSSLGAGSGLNPFWTDFDQHLGGQGHYLALGPAIGNTIEWDPATGRFKNWQCTRRFRFVYLGACTAGKGVMSLAFGCPRGRYPGRGRAFLAFKDTIQAGRLMDFSEKFWNEWKKSGVTVAEAATRAYWHVLNQRKYKTPYVINGDPDLVIK